jgi:serine/threonine protein kinase
MTFVGDDSLRRLVALTAEPEVVAERFELGALLGEGGMGVVFAAWDRQAQRSVALKLLRDVDEAISARFEREAAALSALSHPGIVRYVAHGSTAGGERFLAMEQLVGVTLAERLASGPLGARHAVRLAAAIAAALCAAHGQGLLHRDIKPSNIFLEEGDPARAKLLDFGLARASHAPALTHAGSLLGTPGYMAPEQVRGLPGHDPRSDLFALGAVLFECLTGRAAFVGVDTEAVLTKILVEQPPALRELCPSVPPALEALLGRLLAKDPGRRPAGADEVLAELAALLAQQDADTAPAASGADIARPGRLIAGKYRVVRALGSGGMGIVLLARHEALDRHVAIKLVRGSAHAESGNVERLVREARAVSRLESEHVARVMDVGMLDDGAPFIVMEYLRGKDLGQVLQERQRLPIDVAVDYLLQAGEALAEAHALGIVHRDLKPSNLFLTARRDGSAWVKVLDFGISKLSAPSAAARAEPAPSDASITAPDAIMGSPLYMSPEQLQSAKHVDARTDIWALGVVLHELLTGRRPFEADSVMAIGVRIAAGAPAGLRDACPEAPEGLAAVVRRCLEKDPERRFGSIAELARALAPHAPAASRSSIERIVRIEGALAPGGSADVVDAALTARRRWRALALGGGVAIALGAALFAVWPATLSDSVGPASDAAGAAASAPPVASRASPVASPEPSVRPATPGRSSARQVPPPDAGASAAARRSAAAAPASSPTPAARRGARVREPAARAPVPALPRAAGARPAAAARPDDALDPMNPALIER